MKSACRALLAIIALVGVCLASSGSIVGRWTGRITLDGRKIPPTLDLQARNELYGTVDRLQNARITLYVRPDKTYTITVVGGPHGDQLEQGTWTLKKGAFTTVEKKHNLKPVKSSPPHTYKLSKDGKSMTMVDGMLIVTLRKA